MGKILDFRYRHTIPEKPIEGCFYWVNSGEINEIFFSPSNDPKDMILLNKDFEPIKEQLEKQLQEVKSKMDDIDVEIKNINIYLGSLDDNLKDKLENFLKLNGYLTEKNLKTVNGNTLFGTGDIEIKTEVKIDDETKNDIINEVKKEVETRPLKWTVIDWS